MGDIQFGTDGWRATIAEDYTFDNVRRVAQAVSNYVREDTGTASQGFVIGYDRRFASEHFATAVAEVFAGNDISVFLAKEATPTPVISFSVLSKRAAGAVVITASHNPPMYNGFKVRDHRGVSVAPEALKQIEAGIPDSSAGVKRIAIEAARSMGLVTDFDPLPPYLEYIHENLDLEPIRQAGHVIVHDAMWGVGAGWFDRLVGGGLAKLHSIHQDRNPLFPGMQRPEPIPPNTDALQRTVVEVGADVGIANDGDADRIGLVDEKGRFVTQLQAAGLLALYLLEMRSQRGPIVKTLSSTVMLNILGQQHGLNVVDTAIGPKHVGPKVVEIGAMLGATESGGFLFRGLPERDGILAGLYILDMMARSGKKLSQLLDWLYDAVGTRYFYGRIDTRFPLEQRDDIWQQVRDAQPASICGLAVTDVDTIDPRGFRFMLADGGWLLVRFSGTEPVIRVYTETDREDRVQSILEEGLRIAGLKP